MKKNGFTTVEMLVVLAIIVILPTVVIANFPQVKLQFALSRVAYAFAQDVRRAQDMSLSAIQYKDSFGIMQPISGYGVYLNMDSLGNKQYIIYADAYPGNQQYDDLDYVTEIVDLPSTEQGVVIKQIDNIFGNSASINFNPPDPTTTIASFNQNETSIDVIFALETDFSKTRTVSINSSGLIEVR